MSLILDIRHLADSWTPSVLDRRFRASFLDNWETVCTGIRPETSLVFNWGKSCLHIVSFQRSWESESDWHAVGVAWSRTLWDTLMWAVYTTLTYSTASPLLLHISTSSVLSRMWAAGQSNDDIRSTWREPWPWPSLSWSLLKKKTARSVSHTPCSYVIIIRLNEAVWDGRREDVKTWRRGDGTVIQTLIQVVLASIDLSGVFSCEDGLWIAHSSSGFLVLKQISV